MGTIICILKRKKKNATCHFKRNKLPPLEIKRGVPQGSIIGSILIKEITCQTQVSTEGQLHLLR